MKKTYLLLLILNFSVFGQVGIKTTAPTADLDVNGNMRLRNISATTSEAAAKDSVLVADLNGNIKRTTSKKIWESQLKSLVKGSFSSSSDVSLTLSANTKKIPFDYEEMDYNNEFNTSTSTYTAKQDGVYAVTVQIKGNASLGIATDFGVAILKNGTVMNRNTFANIGVVSVNVSPPLRSVQTILSLSTGDNITFNVTSSLGSLSILGTKEDCFFTIQQIR